MKISALLFLIIFSTISATKILSQTILVSGSIISNTIWSADTVKIIGDITVTQGNTLTINPGTYIESQGYYRINILGTIRAIGTQTDSIVFTVLDNTSFWQDTTSVSGGWAGIKIGSNEVSADTSIFEFCKIQYAKKYDIYGGDIKGGAIFASNFGTLVIKNSLFNSNMVICYTDGLDGPAGGAIYCKNVSNVNIDNCRFISNRSFSNGGAIHIDEQCQAIITNNFFSNNMAIWWDHSGGWLFIGGVGAAIATSDDLGYSPTIYNNYFFNNVTLGGIIYTSNRNGLVFNNIICNNNGSGIMDGHQLSTSRFFNNTIVNNRTSDGGIQLCSKAQVYNNICWGNELYPGFVTDQISGMLSHPTLFSNCVQYGNGGLNSINIYPEFTHPSAGVGNAYNGTEGDWSLTDWSPCVNRGSIDTTGLYIPEYDLAGNPRIYGVSIDIGCYENQVVLTDIQDKFIHEGQPKVFPNPGTCWLNVESFEREATLELIDMSGQIVTKNLMHNGLNNINTALLSPGTYLYRILNKKYEIVYKGKWIKR